ncbi:MAG: hypothetical protein P8Y23_12050 [Candidatus Lokiarchaeota archaeon]
MSCPVCKKEKILKFPKTVINQAKQLTTISLPKGLVCDHHFQAFVDKNFMVRGYQKVDFEFAYDVLKKNNPEVLEDLEQEHDFYNNLIFEGNYVEYIPNMDHTTNGKNNSNSNEKKMTLADIYKEFWEYIDDDNQEFKEFIKKDSRRK